VGLSVTVLGCSGSYAAVGGACTGYLVETSEARVWLDAGPGTLANLQRHVVPAELDAVVLTHEHPDHWLEIPVFVNVLKHFTPPSEPVPVFLTAGTAALLHAFHPDAQAPAGPVDLHLIDATSEVVIGDQQWRFSRTDHPVETLAVHVTAGEDTFAFTADTGPGWGLAAFGRPIGLAFSESSLPDREPWPDVAHLTPHEAAERAVEAEVEQLVLTHLPPGADPEHHRSAAAAVFGRPVGMAQVGATFSVSHPRRRGTTQ
jgi:ribonuclease BN (tRNA processing enzyme)